MVFRLARDRAGVAANALAIVDDEPVSHPNFWQARKLIPRGLGIVADCQPQISDSLEAEKARVFEAKKRLIVRRFTSRFLCELCGSRFSILPILPAAASPWATMQGAF
jgi:hypothetical protein